MLTTIDFPELSKSVPNNMALYVLSKKEEHNVFFIFLDGTIYYDPENIKNINLNDYICVLSQSIMSVDLSSPLENNIYTKSFFELVNSIIFSLQV